MGLWQRFTLIFKSKASKALDRAEDPRETLDYSYEKQLELLQKVRRGVADVATSRKRIELQLQGLSQKESTLGEQARAALAQGGESSTPRCVCECDRARRRHLHGSGIPDGDLMHVRYIYCNINILWFAQGSARFLHEFCILHLLCTL